MKFYLCQTQDGPQYVHLQAEAKKIDPNYETVELDLAKQPIMDRLNDLMRQAHATRSAVSTDAGEEEGGIQTALTTPPPPPKPVIKVSMPPHAARNDAQIAWEEFIWAIPSEEAYRLPALSKVIAERQREIEEKAA